MTYEEILALSEVELAREVNRVRKGHLKNYTGDLCKAWELLEDMRYRHQFVSIEPFGDGWTIRYKGNDPDHADIAVLICQVYLIFYYNL